jgi:hypothetical protein
VYITSTNLFLCASAHTSTVNCCITEWDYHWPNLKHACAPRCKLKTITYNIFPIERAQWCDSIWAHNLTFLEIHNFAFQWIWTKHNFSWVS